jgi:hypothetical protein
MSSQSIPCCPLCQGFHRERQVLQEQREHYKRLAANRQGNVVQLLKQLKELKQVQELQEDLKEELKQAYDEYDKLAKTNKALIRETQILEAALEEAKTNSIRSRSRSPSFPLSRSRSRSPVYQVSI